MKTA
jgi:hypothetical protein